MGQISFHKRFKTQEQAARALQEKGYRMFASRKIVNIQTAIVKGNEMLLKAFVRPSMENKPDRPLWILFTENKPSKADVQLESLVYVATFLQPFMHWRNIAEQAILH